MTIQDQNSVIERLADLRDVLNKIPGAAKLPAVLEYYELRAGNEVLIGAWDIRTGQPDRKPNPEHIENKE